MVSSLAKREKLDRCSDLAACKNLNERTILQIHWFVRTSVRIHSSSNLIHCCSNAFRSWQHLHERGDVYSLESTLETTTQMVVIRLWNNCTVSPLLSSSLTHSATCPCKTYSQTPCSVLVDQQNCLRYSIALDTHDRVATCVKGITFQLVPNTFTAVSIDILRHTMVSSADTKRSWHETSIQATQPLYTKKH